MASEGFVAQNASPVAAATPIVSEQPQPVHSVLNTAPKDNETTSFEKAKAAAGGENPEAPKSSGQFQPPVSTSTDHPLSGAIAGSEPRAPVENQQETSAAAPLEPQTGEKRTFDSTVVANSAPAPPSVPAPAPAPVSESQAPAAPAPAPAPVPEATSMSTPVTHPAPPAPAPTSAVETSAAAPAPVPAPAPASDERDKPLPEKPEEPEPKKQKIEAEGANDANGSVPVASAAEGNGAPKKSGRPKKDKVKDAVKKVILTDGIGSRTRSRTKPT